MSVQVTRFNRQTFLESVNRTRRQVLLCIPLLIGTYFVRYWLVDGGRWLLGVILTAAALWTICFFMVLFGRRRLLRDPGMVALLDHPTQIVSVTHWRKSGSDFFRVIAADGAEVTLVGRGALSRRLVNAFHANCPNAEIVTPWVRRGARSRPRTQAATSEPAQGGWPFS